MEWQRTGLLSAIGFPARRPIAGDLFSVRTRGKLNIVEHLSLRVQTHEEAARRPSWAQVLIVGKNPRRTVVRIVVLVAACLVIFNFVLLPIRIQGVSMMPTYKQPGINFVNRLAYLFHEPQRGDVVAIRYAGPHVMLMKRIVGLPGELVGFHEGHAIINGQVLDEPYVKYPCFWEIEPRKLGSGEYYVVGDNRSMVESDHTKGVALRRRLVGKVLL